MSDNDDRAALLDQLKIDRSAEPTDSGRPIKWFIGIAVLAGIAFTYFLFDAPAGGDDLVDVSTAVARSASAHAAGSVLDATGYVVARRQATVSSKATGKVVEVLIEEGMVVAEGQLLARLDDSIPRAQLALAESQVAAAESSIAELEVQIKQAELDLERTQGLRDRLTDRHARVEARKRILKYDLELLAQSSECILAGLAQVVATPKHSTVGRRHQRQYSARQSRFATA